MLLNFRQLEVFRAVMIAKTISGAAEILNVSQPGISRLLKYMEYKLGIALFERHKGRLIATPEGLELFRELEPIYQRVEGLDDTINRIIKKDSQQFHIACTPSLSNVVMPWLFARVRQAQPDCVLKLETLANEMMVEYISQRRIDFAIAFGNISHPLLLTEPSIELRLQAIVHRSHPLASRCELSFADLVKTPFISYFPETLLGQLIKQGFAELGEEPYTAVMVRYSDDACAMAEQQLGVTLAFEYSAVTQRYPELTAIPLAAPAQQVYFVRHAEVSMSNHLRLCYENARASMLHLAKHGLT